jgi:hypothetical protein
MVRINLLERFFSRNSASQSDWSREATGSGSSRSHQTSNTAALFGSNYSPQDITNNDFYYDDEFSVQFDANLNNFNGDLELGACESMTNGHETPPESETVASFSSSFDTSHCSNDGFGLCEKSWTTDSNSYCSEFESAVSSTSSSFRLQPGLTAWGTFRDLSNLTVLSPADSLLQTSEGLPAMVAGHVAKEDSNANNSDLGCNSPAEQRQLICWGSKRPKVDCLAEAEPHLITSTGSVPLASWAQPMTDEKNKASNVDASIGGGCMSNGTKLITWQNVKGRGQKPEPEKRDLTTWQSLKASRDHPLNLTTWSNKQRKADANICMFDADFNSVTFKTQHSGPLLSLFSKSHLTPHSEIDIVGVFSELHENDLCTRNVVHTTDSIVQLDQPAISCKVSGGVSNQTTFSHTQDESLLQLASFESGMLQTFTMNCDDTVVDESLRLCESIDMDVFFNKHSDIPLVALSSSSDLMLFSDCEEISVESTSVDNRLDSGCSAKVESSSQVSVKVGENSNGRVGHRRAYFTGQLPDLGFLRDTISSSSSSNSNSGRGMLQDASMIDSLRTSASESYLCGSHAELQGPYGDKPVLACLGDSRQLPLHSHDVLSSSSSAVSSSCFSSAHSQMSPEKSFRQSVELCDWQKTVQLPYLTCAENIDAPPPLTSSDLHYSYNSFHGTECAQVDNEQFLMIDSSSMSISEQGTGDSAASSSSLCEICRPFSNRNLSNSSSFLPGVDSLSRELPQKLKIPALSASIGTLSESDVQNESHQQIVPCHSPMKPNKSILTRRGIHPQSLQLQCHISGDCREEPVLPALPKSQTIQCFSVGESTSSRPAAGLNCLTAQSAKSPVKQLCVANEMLQRRCTVDHKTVSFSDRDNIIYCFSPETGSVLVAPKLIADDPGYQSMVEFHAGYASNNDSHQELLSDDDSEMPPNDFSIASTPLLPPSCLSVSTPAAVVPNMAVDLSHIQELIADVEHAVQLLKVHFSQAKDTTHRAKLGNTTTNAEVGRLVVRVLCPAIHAVLLDGLKSHLSTLFGKVRNSAWRVVEASIRTNSMYRELFGEIKSKKAITSPWLLFNAFISALLNHKAVDMWLLHLHTQKSLLTRHYTASAFLCRDGPGSIGRQLYMRLVAAVRPLARMPFHLELDFEYYQLRQQHQRQLGDSNLLDSACTSTSLPASSSTIWHYGRHAAVWMQNTVSSLSSGILEGFSSQAAKIATASSAARSVTVDVEGWGDGIGSFRQPTSPSVHTVLNERTDACNQSIDSGFDSILVANQTQCTENSSHSQEQTTGCGETSSKNRCVDYVVKNEKMSKLQGPVKLEQDRKVDSLARLNSELTSTCIQSSDASLGLSGISRVVQNRNTNLHPSSLLASLTFKSSHLGQLKQTCSTESPQHQSTQSKQWTGLGTWLVDLADKVLLSDVDHLNDLRRLLVSKPKWFRQSADISESRAKICCAHNDFHLCDHSHQPEEERKTISGVSERHGEMCETGEGPQSDLSDEQLQPPEQSPCCVQTLCHYVATDAGELSFSKGDQLQLLCRKTDSSDWLLCRHGNLEGLVHWGCVRQL